MQIRACCEEITTQRQSLRLRLPLLLSHRKHPIGEINMPRDLPGTSSHQLPQPLLFTCVMTFKFLGYSLAFMLASSGVMQVLIKAHWGDFASWRSVVALLLLACFGTLAFLLDKVAEELWSELRDEERRKGEQTHQIAPRRR